MGFVTDVFGSMWKILEAFVPIGVDPVYFWLTLVITFGLIFLILQAIPFFKDSRGIAFIVALVMAYFTASSAFVTIIIAKLFPNIGLAIMALLGLLLVIAFLSPNAFEGGLRAAPFITIVAFVIVIYLTYSAVGPELQAAGYISDGLGTSIGSDDVALIIAVLIVVGVVYTLVGKKKETGPPEALKWLFGRGWK